MVCVCVVSVVCVCVCVCVCVEYLTGGAVGQAGLVVGRQIEVGGAGAPVVPPWRQQAQVAAPAVCHLALVFWHCQRETGRKRGGTGE